MSQAAAIQLLAEEVRTKTIRLLEDTPERAMLWAPAGTSNHILWHAGHALWLGDVTCLEPLLGQSKLPGAWADSFGAKCRPVSQTKTWPAKALVVSALRAQLRAILSEVGKATDELLDEIASPTSKITLARRIIHGLHDEANHQGEMYLLQKLYQAQLGEAIISSATNARE
jgi:hypothetical protein